jgi:hypothetical protein
LTSSALNPHITPTHTQGNKRDHSYSFIWVVLGTRPGALDTQAKVCLWSYPPVQWWETTL